MSSFHSNNHMSKENMDMDLECFQVSGFRVWAHTVPLIHRINI
uniref:Uncharacterized protein n=1 Tax=Arundo donax TaxID=35708 RepID=A0A0A8ZF69_ARUDO